MTLLPAILALTLFQAPTPRGLVALAFRTEAPTEADQKLLPAEREERLLAAGFVSVPCDEVRVYADPRLLDTPASAAARRLSGFLSGQLDKGPLAPGSLTTEQARDLGAIAGGSSFGNAIAALPRNTAWAVAFDSKMSVDLAVDGRTVRLVLDSTKANEEDAPVALPQGVEAAPKVPLLVVDWISAPMAPGIVDPSVESALKALHKARLEARKRASKAYETMAKARFVDPELDPARASFESLAKRTQDGLRDYIRVNAAFLGFKSPSEAQSALETGKIAGMRFSVGVTLASRKEHKAFTFSL